MNKKILLGVAAGCAIAAAVAAANKGQTGPKPTIWEKMRQGMEEMPEDFPPRVMFDNIETTKANTEEILTLLRPPQAPAEDTEIISSN